MGHFSGSISVRATRPRNTYDPGAKLVDIQSTCNFITVRNCLIKGAPSVEGWTQADWTNRLGSGKRR